MFKKSNIFKILITFTMFFFIIGTGFSITNAQGLNEKSKKIGFGYVAWPGVTVKTHVVQKISEYLGYDVTLTSAMKPTILKGLDMGDLDVFLGLWLPQMNNDFQPYYEKGSIKKVRVNLEEVVWTSGVPKYVWEAGVKSHTDLTKFADKFNNKWYGLEAGSSGNAIMQKAIKNNLYGLKDWEVTVSSTAGMMSAVKSHIQRKEWIVWSAWKPHWMNIAYDVKYLKDPEHIWAKKGTDKQVLTVIRDGFKEDMPNYYRFLKQFKITSPIQSKWIMEYGNKKRDPEKIAEEWIANNLGIVNQWVFGVKSVNGKMARKVIKQKVDNN